MSSAKHQQQSISSRKLWKKQAFLFRKLSRKVRLASYKQCPRKLLSVFEILGDASFRGADVSGLMKASGSPDRRLGQIERLGPRWYATSAWTVLLAGPSVCWWLDPPLAGNAVERGKLAQGLLNR